MSSQRRKVDQECRLFNDKWKVPYFFVDIKGKPTCLICKQNVAVIKEYNVRRHYETNHAEKYKDFVGKLREDKYSELLTSLKRQQETVFVAHKSSDDSVKASYVLAHEIAACSKPFSEGEFLKKCMLKAADIVCPEKRQVFANISLSRNTVAERVTELGQDLNRQLQEKLRAFLCFSIAIDESTDVSDIAQLAIFIRGVDDNMVITEELLELVPLKSTTTAADIFDAVVSILDNFGADWGKLVSGAPSMIARRIGVMAKLREKVTAVNGNQGFTSFHCILHQEALCCKILKMEHVMDVVFKTVNYIRAKGLNHRQFNTLLENNCVSYGLPYHTDVRWLSRGTVLKRFLELREEIRKFMDEEKKPVVEFEDPEWVQDLAFMVDITEHLNVLNLKLQGRDSLITQHYDNIRAFEMKLRLWETQLSASNLTHFPQLKSIRESLGLQTRRNVIRRYQTAVSILRKEFQDRFADFRNHESEFSLFTSPFSADVEKVEDTLQMELIELQCDSVLKEKFVDVGVPKFYTFLPPTYPKLRMFAARLMCMFGTTYVCEQVFSLMNVNKSKLRSVLTNAHLNATLKVAAAQSFSPDIERLVSSKRCQISSSNGRNNAN